MINITKLLECGLLGMMRFVSVTSCFLFQIFYYYQELLSFGIQLESVEVYMLRSFSSSTESSWSLFLSFLSKRVKSFYFPFSSFSFKKKKKYKIFI